MLVFFVASMSSCLVCSPRCTSRVVITTVAPSIAKPVAVSLPIPDVAPVISTIFPFILAHQYVFMKIDDEALLIYCPEENP
jgi:hypothetical protein